MKKYSFNNQLSNLKNVKDITYKDYLLYKQINEANKHPHINKSLITGGLLISTGIAFIGFSFITLPILAWLGICITLLGMIPLESGINKALDDLDNFKEYLKEFKQLNKTKNWEHIKSIMSEYELSNKFNEDKKSYEVDLLESDISNKKMEILKISQQHTNNVAKINNKISLIRKKINEIKANESALEDDFLQNIDQEPKSQNFDEDNLETENETSTI